MSSKHNFALFGLGGMSSIDVEDSDEEDEDLIGGKFNGKNKVGVLGLAHTFQLNDDMYIKSALAGTGTESNFNYAIPANQEQFYTIETGKIGKSSLIRKYASCGKLSMREIPFNNS